MPFGGSPPDPVILGFADPTKLTAPAGCSREEAQRQSWGRTHLSFLPLLPTLLHSPALPPLSTNLEDFMSPQAQTGAGHEMNKPRPLQFLSGKSFLRSAHTHSCCSLSASPGEPQVCTMILGHLSSQELQAHSLPSFRT